VTIKEIAKPYLAQYRRSPRWVRSLSFLIIMYIATPIDLWDILVPFAAYADDLFLAGVLLKLLHKYGSLPDEEQTSPRDIINQIKSERASNEKR
jgi:uncharacterized membrane protein YkvA (DUF1232 family)